MVISRSFNTEYSGDYVAVMTHVGQAQLVLDARELPQTLLAHLPERWRHTAGVARQAERVVGAVPGAGEAEIPVAAAWLHDVGYAEQVRDTRLRATVQRVDHRIRLFPSGSSLAAAPKRTA
jgi:hypothetical protein